MAEMEINQYPDRKAEKKRSIGEGPSHYHLNHMIGLFEGEF
jgi:hypothetical protein